MGRATTVVLAEDSFIVREGVRMLLEESGYDILALAEDYDGLLEAVDTQPPDVVITDIRMPPTNSDEGVRAARRIRSEHPDVGVVVLSQYVEPEYALRLLEDGSAGLAYLLKERVGDLGELEAAIASYREALSREAADAASWLKLGHALVLTGEPGKAAASYRQAIRRAPRLAAAHNGLGAALMSLGERAGAEEELKRALALDEHDANPLMNLALLRERAGDRSGAMRAWRRALERDPGSHVAQRNLARLGG